MVDKVPKEKRSQIMRAVKQRNTKLETIISKELHKRGIRYRKNNRYLFGIPDISIKKWKVVIFIDSCFWHGCNMHFKLPKSNTEYWEEKISRNTERDAEVTKYYKERGWYIIRIWEHEIKNDLQNVTERVIKVIEDAKSTKSNISRKTLV